MVTAETEATLSTLRVHELVWLVWSDIPANI